MALPVDSFTLAMVGIAPANTASTEIITRMQKSDTSHVMRDLSFCTAKQWQFLTRACVVLDPLQELFLREVAEFSYDVPLTLQVRESLDCHDGQYSHDCQLEFNLLSYPAEQLQMWSKHRTPHFNHLKAFALMLLCIMENLGWDSTCLEQIKQDMMHMWGVRKSFSLMMSTASTANATSCRLWYTI